MYSFECEGPNGRTIVNYEKLTEYTKKLFEQYPMKRPHRRFQLMLAFPSDSIEAIPLENGNEYGKTTQIEEKFSTVLEILPAFLDTKPKSENSHILFIEDGHENPLGEHVTLYSTAITFIEENANRFAFFRNKYWRVLDFVAWQPIGVREILCDKFMEEITNPCSVQNYKSAVRIEDNKMIGFFLDIPRGEPPFLRNGFYTDESKGQ